MSRKTVISLALGLLGFVLSAIAIAKLVDVSATVAAYKGTLFYAAIFVPIVAMAWCARSKLDQDFWYAVNTFSRLLAVTSLMYAYIMFTVYVLRT